MGAVTASRRDRAAEVPHGVALPRGAEVSHGVALPRGAEVPHGVALPRAAEVPHGGALPRGAVVWITGLSAAGKSSVARQVARRVEDRGVRPVLLDGDELREVLGVTGAHDLRSRRRRAFVYGRLCRLLADQGHVVICAAIALFHAVHEWNRQHLRNYVEVLLDVPLEELERRDPKGLYGPTGDRAQVIGVGLAAEFPTAPDLVVPNFGDTTPASAAELIMHALLAQGGRRP